MDAVGAGLSGAGGENGGECELKFGCFNFFSFLNFLIDEKTKILDVM